MCLEPANEEHAEHEFVHVSTEPGHDEAALTCASYIKTVCL